MSVEKGAGGRAEISDVVAATRSANHGVARRYGMVREDQIVIGTRTDPYPAALDAMLDRGECIRPDQLGTRCTPRTLARRWLYFLPLSMSPRLRLAPPW